MAVLISGFWAPAGAIAAVTQPQSTDIRGSIVSADGLTAVVGVTVKAANLDSLQVFASDRTAADGSYVLSGLPAGSYDLAVETPEGLFAADSVVTTQPGQHTLLSLALRPGAEDPKDKPATDDKKDDPGKQGTADEGKKKEGDKEGAAKEPEPQEKKKKKGGSFWRRKTGAAIAIGAGAILIGAAAANSSKGSGGNDNSMTGGTSTVPK